MPCSLREHSRIGHYPNQKTKENKMKKVQRLHNELLVLEVNRLEGEAKRLKIKAKILKKQIRKGQ